MLRELRMRDRPFPAHSLVNSRRVVFFQFDIVVLIMSQSLRRFPLRLILILPFVLQIFAAVGLVGYLSFRNGQKAIAELTKTDCNSFAKTLQPIAI